MVLTHHVSHVGTRRLDDDPGSGTRSRAAKKRAAGAGQAEQLGHLQGAAGTLIRLSVGEIRRLLWQLVFRVEQTAAAVLAWSRWRRQHQALAKFYHYQRRGALAYLQL